MIEHVYRRAADARSVSSIIVATDDERIASAVRAFGGDARMTSASHQSGTDRIAEVARSIECDLIVNVQGDEPLLQPAMIDEAVSAFDGDPTLAMSTLRRRIDDPAELLNPNVTKVVVDRHDYALYFSRAPIPHVRSGRAAGRRLAARRAVRLPAGLPPRARVPAGDGSGAIRGARTASRARARHQDQGRRNTIRLGWCGHARRSGACQAAVPRRERRPSNGPGLPSARGDVRAGE